MLLYDDGLIFSNFLCKSKSVFAKGNMEEQRDRSSVCLTRKSFQLLTVCYVSVNRNPSYRKSICFNILITPDAFSKFMLREV